MIFEELKQYKNEFYKIYHNQLKYMLSDCETLRCQRISKLVLIEIFIFLFASLWCLPLFRVNLPLISGITIGFSIFLAVFMVIIYYLEFQEELKKTVIPRIINCFPNLSWGNKSLAISDYCLKTSDLFPDYSKRKNDDVFHGCYKGVSFDVNEIRLEYTAMADENQGGWSVFKGIVINFQSNKIIRNRTIISPKPDKNIKNRNIIIILELLAVIYAVVYSIINSGIVSDFIVFCIATICILYELFVSLTSPKDQILNEITMEDPEFNKRYKAYSSDEVEGRYLITTAFMERFKNLQNSFGSDNVKCSFYDVFLMFSIKTSSNHFEIGNLFSPIDNPKRLEKLFNQLASIYSMIDYFKLDEKIGM